MDRKTNKQLKRLQAKRLHPEPTSAKHEDEKEQGAVPATRKELEPNEEAEVEPGVKTQVEEDKKGEGEKGQAEPEPEPEKKVPIDLEKQDARK